MTMRYVYPNRRRNRTIVSYRLWLYGCNVVLIVLVLIFAIWTYFILHDRRMALIPLGQWEPLVLLVYIGATLQLVDALFCFIGLWRNVILLIYLYWIFLLLLTLFDFVFGILWVFRWQQLHTGTPGFILDLINTNYNDTELCTVWDEVQSEFDCCGVNSYRDWLSVPYWCTQDLGNETVLPRSCCQNSYYQCNSSVFALINEDEDEDDEDQKQFVFPGCKKHVALWMHSKGGNLFLLGFCFVILLKIVFLIILRTEIREFSYEIDAQDHRNSITLDRAFSIEVEETPLNQEGTNGVHANSVKDRVSETV